MTIRIVTDSTCDLPQDLVETFGIKVVPLYINFGSQGYLDGVDLSRSDFYRRLPDSDPFPTTATPGPQQFSQAYNELAAEGATEILSIHISVSLSATVEVARSAARETDSVPVMVLDSQQLSLGTGFQVLAAARAAAEGKTMGEILDLLDSLMQRTHVFAALDTLEYLRRSGRMNRFIAGFGSLLQIKPLLKMYRGEPATERVRTTNGATKRLLSLLEARAPFEQVALVHTNAGEKAAALSQEAVAILPEGDLISVDITPVIGAHIGPGAIGFVCVEAIKR